MLQKDDWSMFLSATYRNCFWKISSKVEVYSVLCSRKILISIKSDLKFLFFELFGLNPSTHPRRPMCPCSESKLFWIRLIERYSSVKSSLSVLGRWNRKSLISLNSSKAANCGGCNSLYAYVSIQSVIL